MTDLELIAPIEARDEDTERYARELAEDLGGTEVSVAWLMATDELYLARRDG